MEWVDKYRWQILLVTVVVVVTGVVFIQVRRPKPPPLILSTSTPQPTPEPTPTPSPLRVYVSGAVMHPDVYTVAPNSIVKDVLMAAGGPSDEADLDRINLAQPVADGQQIHIPRHGEESPPVQPASDQRNLQVVVGKININTADQATLESLPGIGPAIAQRILEYREVHGSFGSPEEIVEVIGIGPDTLERLRDLITTD